jgi:hypothetical protein
MNRGLATGVLPGCVRIVPSSRICVRFGQPSRSFSARFMKRLEQARLERERRTIEAMIACFCRGRHGSRAGLCPECLELLEYATARLERCPFQEDKPTCVKCPIHCYQPARREQVKAVMGYAGPRIMWRHPILSLRHMLDAYRPIPPVPKKTGPPGA